MRAVLEAWCSLCELEQLQPQKNHMRLEAVTQDARRRKAWETVSLKVQQCILHPPPVCLCIVMKHGHLQHMFTSVSKLLSLCAEIVIPVFEQITSITSL